MNVRPATPDDFDAMLALLVADEEFTHGRASQLAIGDLREWLSRTKLETESWLYEDGDRLCGLGWCDMIVGSDVLFAVGVVHPEWKGRGIGSELVDRSEGRGAAHSAARLHQVAFGADGAAADLFVGRGYTEVRRFYEMAIELDAPPDAPPVGIETLNVEEAEQFHAALDEAFQDHWEHHSQPFAEWWKRQSRNPSFDPTLWFVIRDGGEMAAVSRNEANRNGGGYVAAIGVRRPYRGRGYAKALLLHTFREFYERGMPRVTLGVDAENPTGATHLYERVGMHAESENVVYEKMLA